jgi:alkanesulfonate monooxygenase SsuD/methylene tetrahydromethanopterin reductase-like flavin-dependent oxidoreductase (luciferase family)
LNHWFGQKLGFADATHPRFMWAWAPDLFFLRDMAQVKGSALGSQGPEKICWASRVGRVWMLAQWRPPDRYGPARYHGHAETALAFGVTPTLELTQQLAWVLDQQITTSYENHLKKINQGLEEQKESEYSDWVDYVQNFNPAFGNFAPGARGGHVSFPGVQRGL